MSRLQSALLLQPAQGKETEHPDTRYPRKPDAFATACCNNEYHQGHSKQRIDDGHGVPRNARIGKRPQQLRTIGRAGVQQAVRGIAHQTRQIGLTGTEPLEKPKTAGDGPQDQKDQQCPYRYKYQGVGELPVELQKQNGIR